MFSMLDLGMPSRIQPRSALIDFQRVLIGTDVERYDDHQYGCVRLIPKRTAHKVNMKEWARRHISDQLHEAASQGMNLYPDLQKIPRPPNSFILYRKHFHKSITASNPGVPNTEICESCLQRYPFFFHP